MGFIRSILAVTLTLLVAAPVCCCTAEAMTGSDPPGCCDTGSRDSGDRDSDGHVCACPTKEPREAAKNLELPDHVVSLLQAVAVEHFDTAPPAPMTVPKPPVPHACSDPPRLLLARCARWLL